MALGMRNQSKKSFRGIFIGIPQHQKGYLIYIPSTQKSVSSHVLVCDEKVSSAVAYTSPPFSETLATQPSVLYIPNATQYLMKTV